MDNIKLLSQPLIVQVQNNKYMKKGAITLELSKKMYEIERTLFVGRDKEMELMLKHVSGDWPWLWLHIYGQSGIGKTSLLKRFKSEIENSCYFYLDGYKRVHKKEDMFAQLSERLRVDGDDRNSVLDSAELSWRIKSHAQHKEGKVVFLIDEFDRWRSADEWLIPWLAELKLDVRVITVGRHPLTGGWLRSGFSNFTYSFELKALSAVDVELYALKRELSDKDFQTQLFRFSRGVPLAMVLAAEVMLREEGSQTINRQKQLMLTEVMMEQMLKGLPSYLHRLIEAASVYSGFNEERLAAAMEEEVDPGSFRRLTGLPFVNLKEYGWMLHDAVRAWALDDLQLRKPNHFEQMRKKALEQIQLEERINPNNRGSLQLEKMNLHENPLVRNICFSGHIDDVELSECRENDLPDMEEIYYRFHQFVIPGNSQERHMERLIRPIWEADPSSFVAIKQKGKLIAFYGKIPLNQKIMQVLAEDSLFLPLIKGWKQRSNAYLLTFLAIAPELEDKTRGYIIHTIINYLSRSEWILVYTCLKEWYPIYELYGFEPQLWADGITEHGTKYRAFSLDLTEEDFFTKLDRSLSDKSVIHEKSREISSKEAVPKLKMILKDWAELPLKPALYETYFQLFPHRKSSEEDGSMERQGFYVQQDIKNGIDLLTGGDDERDEVYGKILKYTYIQRTRPQERVAERLNLSMATYYRYLNKALERLIKLLGFE
jgi:hypothetical protein